MGIYFYLLLVNCVLEKLKCIMWEEFEKIGVVEMLMFVILLVEFWEELGCYEIYGLNLYCFKDCNDWKMIFGLIYEEIFIDLMCNEINLYKKLFLNFY